MEQFDVFICHASEDKDVLVRPLARRLEEEHVAVWFDEFTLRPGDSLRRSIDLGLSRSRFGAVVLSPAFFGKRWPQRELDGLVSREMIEGRRLVVPIWHRVSKEDVCDYSPPLADIVAIHSQRGLDHVIDELLRVLRPNASPLIIARDILFDHGLEPPVVTDEWWLDMVAVSNWLSPWGFVPDCGEWGRWAFPLPDDSSPQSRGERIAWAAMQLRWSEAAEESRLSQLTPPDKVLEFVGAYPGLREACHSHPTFLAVYAPQLTIPGLGGEFEPDFDAVLEWSRHEHEPRGGTRSGTGLTTTGDTPRCSEFIALHDPEYGSYEPTYVTCAFVQGELSGPPNKVYEHMDYLTWLLSAKGSWIPPSTRAFLLEGMKGWPVWPWVSFAEDNDHGLEEYPEMGALAHALLDHTISTSAALGPLEVVDLTQRITASVRLLDLPETPETLVARFLEQGFIESYVEGNEARKARRSQE